ncbi:MAG: ABC transporter permease [Dorea sp.]|nr:ABC transporter permease [Dorea sp.]
MDLSTIMTLGQTTLELGLIYSLTTLALFLSYTMLNVCDLSTNGCYTLGAAVGAVVALAGHPFLSIPMAMLAGCCSGFVTAILQTKMGIDSLLAGIIVDTGLYSINIAVMGGASLLNMNKTTTIFTMMKGLLEGTPLEDYYVLIVAFIAVVLVVLFLNIFLKTRLGLAIRATGNNPDMVKSSSINPAFTTIVGLCVANAFTGLSGCLMAQSAKQVEIQIGNGMVTIALASLLIGGTIVMKGSILLRATSVVVGSIIFRLVYAVALRFHMPAFMLRFVSSVIVILAIAGPYLKSQWPQIKRRMTYRKMQSQRKASAKAANAQKGGR